MLNLPCRYTLHLNLTCTSLEIHTDAVCSRLARSTPPSGRTVEFLPEVPPTVQRDAIIEVRLIDDSIGVNNSWDIL